MSSAIYGRHAKAPKEKKESGRKADTKIEDIMIVNYIHGKVYEATDSNGLSDPYVRIGKVKADTGLFSKTWLSESPVAKKTLTPQWDFEDEVIINKKITKLVVELFDKDTLSDDFIGRAIIDISKVNGYVTFTETVNVYKKEGDTNPSGNVYLSIKKLQLTTSL